MIARCVLGALGVLGIAVGALQVLQNWSEASPFGLAAFFIAVIVLDDLVLVPLALAIGWVLVRYVPAASRPPVQAVLVTLVGLAVIAVPFAVSPARDGENGTLLTQPYGRNVVIIAAAVAAGTGAYAVVRRATRSRQR